MTGDWQGRRVFLTGHTGFKGSWLALWLRRLGADVTGLALAPRTTPNAFTQARVGEGLRSVIADVRDERAVSDAVRDAAPEVVFHLAAQPLVRASYAAPVETFAVNVLGTAHVLEALRGAPSVRAVVVITTDKVYENREWAWSYRESDRLGGHDPYSASKACAEIVCESWRRSFGGAAPWKLATARAGNVIGGGDWADDRLVPDLVRNALAGRTTPIRNPAAVRPWQHVLEPLAGYLTLAEALLRGEAEGAWNFGPSADDQRSVRDVADRVVAAWGDGCAWALDDGGHPHESRALTLDSTRARDALGWRPRLTLDDAVRWTVEWYRDVARGADAHAVTVGQIDSYEALHTA